MIASILGGIAAAPWARPALRYGVIAFVIFFNLVNLGPIIERVAGEPLDTRPSGAVF